jgi:hypothetical protein
MHRQRSMMYCIGFCMRERKRLLAWNGGVIPILMTIVSLVCICIHGCGIHTKMHTHYLLDLFNHDTEPWRAIPCGY